MGKIAVVGGGIAGLACATELTQQGLQVDLFERESDLGGRMRTRVRDHLPFDLGANFFVGAYREILALAKRCGVPLIEVGPREHQVFRDGHLAVAHFDPSKGLFRADFLSFWSRLRLLALLGTIRRQHPQVDFFDLNSLPPEWNEEDAYSLAARRCGHQVADYLIDGFHATMMFYPAGQSAAGLLRALLWMMSDARFDFGVVHPYGHMQGLADSLGTGLNIHKQCLVTSVQPHPAGWRLEWQHQAEVYEKVVLATTAGAARQLIPETFAEHRRVVDDTRYSTTVNVAFSLPLGSLGATHCFYVPRQESELICEITNEASKGPHASYKGRCLATVGLHEEAARDLYNRCDANIYALVKHEFLRLLPDLWSKHVQPHDLQRWKEAIPKYDAGHIQRVRDFQQQYQGQGGLYLCGDYMNAPWLEGACRSGQAVARQILPVGTRA